MILVLPLSSVLADDEDNAMSLYFSGKDSYNSGNYEDAQEFFQQALIKDENIEAKAQNIKYMLGVSAFNNGDYKTAKTYLSLFLSNPIAQDLLNKIDAYEETLPEDFVYHTDNYQKQVTNPTTSSQITDNNQNNEEESINSTSIIIIVVTTVLIISFAVFFEIKKSLFSQIALKLVGVSANTILIGSKNEMGRMEDGQLRSVNENAQTSIPEINTASLLETPFDEEIDIESMASKDIKEISKFFDDVDDDEQETGTINSDNVNEIVIDSILDESQEKEKEYDNARESILNSILDNDANIESRIQDDENALSREQVLIPKPEKIEDEVSKKPKYEHLDNVPDDFNVNKAIDKAFMLIKESQEIINNQDLEDKDFKSIEEMEKEMEEKERMNLHYFQVIEELDDTSMNKFFDYIFDVHSEKIMK